jgi:hypothetical protein
MFLPCLLTLCDEAQQQAWVPLARSKKASRPLWLYLLCFFFLIHFDRFFCL